MTKSKVASPQRRRKTPGFSTKHCGEISELAFMAKAVGLDFHVLKPYGDNQRYDVLVESGARMSRVQVKSTSTVVRGGQYHVNSGRRSTSGPVPYLPSEIDFLAVHVVPEDSWYIIPVAEIYPRVSFLIYPKGHAKPGLYGAYREAWHLLAD